VPAEPIGDDNPIEAILLTAFPNPERIGCPSSDVLKAMANQEIGRDNPAWSHIWKCSPCFRDFKILRDARVARVEREYARQRTRRNLLKTAGAVIASSTAAYFTALEFRARSKQPNAVTIDLREAGVTRGANQDRAPVARLPRQLNEIHVELPRLSLPGRYILAILESQLENTAVALGSANTRSENEQLTLVVTLDLSEVKPGQYFLGTRRDIDGHQEAPSYYPVLVSD